MKRLAFLPVLLLWNLSLAQAQDPWEAWLWRVAQATQGIPYRYGGEDPRTGIDCSAFVRWVMGRAGIPLPRTSREQLRATVPVREYRPGYLLFFSESGREVDHVAIYIGRGYMLHASGKWGGVVVEPVIRYASILVAIGAPRTLLAQK
jgi:cell wall-associated NlpC family hydrolase